MACPRDDIDALCARHPPVHDSDVVVVPLELIDGVVASIDRVDVIAGVRQPEDARIAQTFVVFSDQYAHRISLRRSSAGACPAWRPSSHVAAAAMRDRPRPHRDMRRR